MVTEMRDDSFKAFLKARRAEYLLVLVPIAIVFAVSAFTTNIGWYAIPFALMCLLVMSAVKTLTLYQSWKTINEMMKAIKSAGRVYTVTKE